MQRIHHLWTRSVVLMLILLLLAGLAGPAQADAGVSSTPGTPWAWGDNWHGGLGDDTYTERRAPVQVSGLNGVVAIAGGDFHSLALKSDGTVWVWGQNNLGQLGNDNWNDIPYPLQVSGLTEVNAISAGADHNLALKSDGTVWAWGRNGEGQLGDGTTTTRFTPIQVGGLSGVSAIAAGYFHSLALKSDGTVWAWGSNERGQLGDGSGAYGDYRTTPEQVNELSGVTAIAGGGLHSLALKSDGTVWAWGYNYNGELGIGCSDSPCQSWPLPVQVSGLREVNAIAAGANHNLALKSDGTVWAWGSNWEGQIGIGTMFNHQSSPVQVSGLDEVRAISAGGDHSLALENDGTVWAWGFNFNGQLGIGTTEYNRLTPVQVTGLSGVSAIAAGYFHSLALVPAAPVAVDDSYSADEDTPLTVAAPGLLTNDTGANRDPLTASKVTDPAHGKLTLHGDGSFTYIPDTNYYGSDTFTYKASDGSLDSKIATVNITVKHVNHAPLAQPQSVTTDQDTAVTMTLVATDADNDPLTYSIVADPTHGTLSGTDSSQTYIPQAGYAGADSFTFKANDGALDSSIVTVTITINSVNHAPFAANDSYNTNAFTALMIAAPGVLSNDTDADGPSALTAILVSGPAHGTLTLNANGSSIYRPAGNFVGRDGFTYRANDGLADSNVAMVTITVKYNFTGFFPPVDNPPTENTVKAGSGIAVRFSLGGYMGLNIFVSGYPTSKQVSCRGSSTSVGGIEASTTSNSGLAYNTGSGQYTYAWKTDKNWANTCRQFTFRLTDGTDHTALFKFTK